MATASATARCPGVHPKAAYFTRGSGHTQYGAYTEDAAEYQLVLDRLLKKWATAKKLVPRAVIDATAGSASALVSLGSCDGAIREAIDVLKGHGVTLDYMRVRAFPFSEDVEKFLAAHELLFVVEQNRDAQLRSLLTLETRGGQGEAALAAALQRTADLLAFIVEGVLAELKPRALASQEPRMADRRASARSRGADMTFIAKPKVAHPSLPKNALGFTRRDYEGALSTLCAGCGHDSITAAIVEACWGLALEPQNMVKLSGIGCSSKTTAYFVSGGHGFNSVHGRMPSIAMGANAANRTLTYIGVSGDGDTLSIGLGQFCHAIRRNLNMLYIIENNGVYGLTKGQFSASADIGTKAKKGETNFQPPIDPVLLAMTLGASFVARSFSGDKQQLVPLIQAGLKHEGFALIDVLSPCVTFNDHEGSTKSYAYTREHYEPAVHADFVPLEREITADYEPGETLPVVMHDGSRIVLRKLDAAYDPTNRTTAAAQIQERMKAGEYLTGLLFLDERAQHEFHQRERHARGAAQQPALRGAVARVEGAGEGAGALPLIWRLPTPAQRIAEPSA